MHARGVLVVDLHAVHADVAFAGLRVARDDAGQRDEGAAILGQVVSTGSFAGRRPSPCEDDLLAGGVVAIDDLGKKLPTSASIGSNFSLSSRLVGVCGLMQHADAVGDVVERIDVESQLHAALRSRTGSSGRARRGGR